MKSAQWRLHLKLPLFIHPHPACASIGQPVFPVSPAINRQLIFQLVARSRINEVDPWPEVRINNLEYVGIPAFHASGLPLKYEITASVFSSNRTNFCIRADEVQLHSPAPDGLRLFNGAFVQYIWKICFCGKPRRVSTVWSCFEDSVFVRTCVNPSEVK